MNHSIGGLQNYGKRGLHIAAGSLSPDAFEEVIKLLRNFADPNERVDEGLTPVHVAAIYGNYEVLKLLLLYGGDPWLEDVDGNTAIDLCDIYGQNECRTLLVCWSVEEWDLLYPGEATKANELWPTLQYKSAAFAADSVPTQNFLGRSISYCCSNQNHDFRLPFSQKLFHSSEKPQTFKDPNQPKFFKDPRDFPVSSFDFSANSRSELVRKGLLLTSKDKNTVAHENDNNAHSMNSDDFVSDDLSSEAGSNRLCRANDASSRFATFMRSDNGHLGTDNGQLGSGNRHLRSDNGQLNVSKSNCSGSKPSFEDHSATGSEISSSFSSGPTFATCNTASSLTESEPNCSEDYDNTMRKNGKTSFGDGYSDVSSAASDGSPSNVSSTSLGLAISVDSELADAENKENNEENFEFFSVKNSELAKKSVIAAKVSSLNASQLRSKLKDFGCDVGPINVLTEKVYRRRLTSLLFDNNGHSTVAASMQKYSKELHACVDGTWDKQAAVEDEAVFLSWFHDPHRSLRNGLFPACYVYVLLSPSLTLMDRTEVTLNQFLDAIFYVGKGSGFRPLQHLEDASYSLKTAEEVKSEKLRRIVDIWKEGRGVLLLQLNQFLTSAEAHTREAAIIDAIGLKNLTNVRRGSYYGIVCGWTLSRQRRLGSVLVLFAFKLFQLIGAKSVKANHL